MMKGLRLLIIAVSIALGSTVCYAKAAYTIVPVPDTITSPAPLDTAVYNNTAEFFTPLIINEINKTGYMSAPTVTDVREKLNQNYWLAKDTAKAMDNFRRFYTIDFSSAKKLAALYNTNLVLFITATTDANNYITRRTWWDFFNIPGASVIDPAYKINIYSVLIDTDENMIVWSQSYQKTLSVVENRIVATGYTPQTEQLQKMKDYSVYLAPRVAQSIQNTLLTEAQKLVEPRLIHTDYGSIDNVFTKKYRSLRKEIVDATVIPAAKTREGYAIAREKYQDIKEDFAEYKAKKQAEKGTQGTSSKSILPINLLWFKKSSSYSSSPVYVPQTIDKTLTPAVNIITPQADNAAVSTIAVPADMQESSQTTDAKAVSENVPINTLEENTIIKQTDTIESANQSTQNIYKNQDNTIDNIKSENPVQSDTNTGNSSSSANNSASKEIRYIPPVSESTETGALIQEETDIYTNSLDYLPLKPRIREIYTEDTFNAF